MTTTTATYLGPADVLATMQSLGSIEVRIASGERAWARVALAIPYSPAEGDQVLVIGNDLDELYIIGVLRGSGLTKLTVPGDLAIEAPNGAISLSCSKQLELASDRLVETTAPKVRIRAERLDLFAKRTIQRFTNAYTWIAELCQVKSGRTRQVADEGYMVKAERMHVRTSGNCAINAKTIHLG